VTGTPRRVSEEMTYDIAMSGRFHNFVANGIVVHNSYNEESGRYKQLEPVFWVPKRERPLLRGAGYRPSRPTFEPLPDGQAGDEMHATLVEASRDVCARAYGYYGYYQAEIERGIAPEVARRLLPVSIYSSCWVTCNPRALMHFLSLRTHDTSARFVSYPQAEIEEAARVTEAIFSQGWPLTYKAFVDAGRVGP
jgi:thymidylate synthase (FAD)